MGGHPTTLARMLAVMAVTAWLATALTGNVRALHLGAEHQPGATVTGASLLPTAVDPSTETAPAPVLAPMAAPAEATPPHGTGQHMLHLLGACLGMLAGASAILPLLLRWAGFSDRARSRPPGVTRALSPAVQRGAWRPPPLSPPTSSPVLRT